MSEGYKKGLDKGGELGVIGTLTSGEQYRKDFEAGARQNAINQNLIAQTAEKNRESGSGRDYRYGEYSDDEPSISFRERSRSRQIVECLSYIWLAAWEVWYAYRFYKGVFAKPQESPTLLFRPFFEIWSLTSDPVVNVILGVVFTVLMVPVLLMWFFTSIAILIVFLGLTLILQMISLLIDLSQVSTGGMVVSIFIGAVLVFGFIYAIFVRKK